MIFQKKNKEHQPAMNYTQTLCSTGTPPYSPDITSSRTIVRALQRQKR